MNIFSIALGVNILLFGLNFAQCAVTQDVPGQNPSPKPGASLEERRAFWGSYRVEKIVKGYTIHDSNNDGWDDVWLLIHEWRPGGGARTDIEGAPNEDFDGDGVSNYDEMLRHTDPHPPYQPPYRSPEQRAASAKLAARLRADVEREEAMLGSLRKMFHHSPLLHADGTPATRESRLEETSRINAWEIAAHPYDATAEKAKVDAWMSQAVRRGWPANIIPARIDQRGRPVIPQETSTNAARMTRTYDVLPYPFVSPPPAWTGAAPFNLTGAGTRIGHWEYETGARITHQEFTGPGGLSRVRNKDNLNPGQHGTTSAGILIGSGAYPEARGMAPDASADIYNWQNAVNEMRDTQVATNAGNRIDIITVGYLPKSRGWARYGSGWIWWANPATSGIEDSAYGAYDTDQGEMDAMLYTNPQLLAVIAAGNEASPNGQGGPANNTPSTPVPHLEWDGSDSVQKLTYRPNDGAIANGYDTMEGYGTCKNTLTVGAANLLPVGWTGPYSVQLGDYSSRGPTDCGRIKPDLVGSGEVTPTAGYASDTALDTLLHTSSAVVHVGGSLDLLIQHWKNLHPGQPVFSAASLKGVAIHTADECGAEGPDFKFGWGLLNTQAAAALLSLDAGNSNHDRIKETQVGTNGTASFPITASGNGPLRVTMVYTDPAGQINDSWTTLDLPAEQLVNDLNLKIIGPGNVSSLPYAPNPGAPDNPAGTGVNFRDNVEQIEIANPVAGATYTVEVKPNGAVVNHLGQAATQPFSLILSGVQNTPPPDFRIVDFQRTGASSWNVMWPAIVGAVYRLESSGDLLTWQPVSGDYVASQSVVSAVVNAAAARHFFRVRRLF